MDRHFIAEAIQKLARIAWAVRIGLEAGMGWIPAARKNIGHRRSADGPGRVVPVVDAVLNRASQMLIAGDMDGEAAAKRAQSLVAGSLWPAV